MHSIISDIRNTLIVTEVALLVVLLVGAGLIFRNVSELHLVDVGLRTGNILTSRITPAETLRSE